MFKRKNKLMLILIMVIALIGSLTACDIDLGDSSNDNGSQTDIIKPDVPDIEVPVVEFQDIDENELIGNADKDEAKAVILLKGNSAEITGTGASLTTDKEYDIYNTNGVKTGEKTKYGTVVEISESGIYVLQGTLNTGFIAISKKDLTVTLILNGVNIYCENYAAISCLKKSDVIIELAEDSTNYLTDGGLGAEEGKYVYGYDIEEQPNATILIRKDLTICGTGKLIVNSGLNNGIGSRANVTITGGDITVFAINNAIKGNDSINISNGKFTLNSKSDGIKTESVVEGLGNINITGGEFLISSVNDAIQAATSLIVSNAVIKIKTGSGSDAAATADSAKGLKAETNLIILSGSFEIDSNDDSLHSNGNITIQGGNIIAASADDGIHADETVTISGGTISISKSYEGIEGMNVNIEGGVVCVKSTDDGINISGGADSSATQPNRPGIGGQRPGQGVGSGFEVIDGVLTITGGEVYIDASGDGIDSNGNIVMSGGFIVSFGPASDPDVPVDYNGTYIMTGGTLVAMGSAGSMAQQPGSESKQYTFMVKFSNSIPAGTMINVSSSSGTEIVTIKTLKNTKGLVVCSPLLSKTSYKISSGGSHSGTANKLGIYTGGSYAGGTVIKTFTISGIVTTVN